MERTGADAHMDTPNCQTAEDVTRGNSPHTGTRNMPPLVMQARLLSLRNPVRRPQTSSGVSQLLDNHWEEARRSGDPTPSAISGSRSAYPVMNKRRLCSACASRRAPLRRRIQNRASG